MRNLSLSLTFSDTVAAFLQSNGNNVERTIDSLLNNQGGFNDYEFQDTGAFDTGYNQKAWNQPAPKPEKILTRMLSPSPLTFLRLTSSGRAVHAGAPGLQGGQVRQQQEGHDEGARERRHQRPALSLVCDWMMNCD